MFNEGLAQMVMYSDHFKMRKPSHGHEHEVWVDTKHGTYAMVFPENPDVSQSLNHQNNLSYSARATRHQELTSHLRLAGYLHNSEI